MASASLPHLHAQLPVASLHGHFADLAKYYRIRTINLVTDNGAVFNVLKKATNHQILVPNNLEEQ
jgi:hypothetical protein